MPSTAIGTTPTTSARPRPAHRAADRCTSPTVSPTTTTAPTAGTTRTRPATARAATYVSGESGVTRRYVVQPPTRSAASRPPVAPRTDCTAAKTAIATRNVSLSPAAPCSERVT